MSLHTSQNPSHSDNQRRRHARTKAISQHEERASFLRNLAFAALFAGALVLAFVGSVRANETTSPGITLDVPSVTIERMQSIITAQIDAFLADDAEGAYAYAADVVKQRFPTPAQFVSMVQQGYPAVYAPQSYAFFASALTPRGPAQQVEFVGEDGQVWRGLYTFAETPDGELLISGVYLRRQNAQQI